MSEQTGERTVPKPEHSPEPWSVQVSSDKMTAHLEDADGLIASIYVAGPSIPLKNHMRMSYADAVRTVACINACAGIPSETLKACRGDNATHQLIPVPKSMLLINHDPTHLISNWKVCDEFDPGEETPLTDATTKGSVMDG